MMNHGFNPGQDPGSLEDDFELTVTYNLTVIPEPSLMRLAAIGSVELIVGYTRRRDIS